MTPNRQTLKRIMEAAIFSAGRPLSLEAIGELFYEDERPSNEVLRELLAELHEEYSRRGVFLKEVASGYRFQADAELGEWVTRLWEEKPQRYSRALLETLSLIAYRQPITRGEIEDIRGVSVSSQIIKTLLEREWVKVLGHREVPGRPAMYGTTRTFLDYFNLRSLAELPTLAEVRDLDKIGAELDARLRRQQDEVQTSLPLEVAVEVED
ncbi:Prokaryotic chromosome segregation and condensation protein ScpB [gamma proteobacterium HdN1]|nr:Prokaryotic chromosome segregation and condensation protein ScpB [gamma proteobacterium HdN1]